MKRIWPRRSFGLAGFGEVPPRFRAHDEDARRNARAVEEILGQADDGFDEVLLDEFLPDLLFLTAAKEHSVRHDGGHHAVGFARGQHVLCEHEIALLPARGTPAPAEALFELHVGSRVILAEGRVGDDPVEAFQFAAIAVQRMEEGVLALDVPGPDAVENHVKPADGPRGGVAHLAAEAEVGRVAAGLVNVLVADDEHAARTAAWIVNGHARLRPEAAHHETDDIARRVKVAAFFCPPILRTC